MLTLTRKKGQAIILETPHGKIEIVVKELRKRSLRIGIVAPEEVQIWRDEVYEEIVRAREGEEAADGETPGSVDG